MDTYNNRLWIRLRHFSYSWQSLRWSTNTRFYETRKLITFFTKYHYLTLPKATSSHSTIHFSITLPSAPKNEKQMSSFGVTDYIGEGRGGRRIKRQGFVSPCRRIMYSITERKEGRKNILGWRGMGNSSLSAGYWAPVCFGERMKTKLNSSQHSSW
jgi:hypothetical protein